MSRFEIISKTIFQDEKNVYISGIAGSGKSYLLRELYLEAKKRGIISVLTSTTGVSAFNVGGCTIHSWTGIVLPTQLPKDPEEYIGKLVSRIRFKRHLSRRWQTLKIIFIDEVSMLGANYIDVVDNVARRIRNINRPFGGIQVVASGDFLQLPPVLDNFCFESPVWDEMNFMNYILTKAYRFTQQEWSDILQRARLGKLTQSDIDTLKKCVNKVNTSDIQPTVIYSLRKDVDDLNDVAMDDLPTTYIEFFSEDVLEEEEKKDVIITRHCNEEQSKVLDANLNVGRKIKLKEGAQVMLVANLDVDMGLVNGSRGVITSIKENVVNVKFKGKSYEFEEPISTYQFKIEHQGEMLIRKMIPIIPAFSSTIHKMQGLTIDCAIVNCGDSIFSPGQAYVALSRCRSLDGLYLERLKPDKIFPNKVELKFEEKIRKIGVFIDNK